MTPSSSDPKHPRLLSFTLDGWDVLGDRVSVTLSDGVAILVGRNGAGKSAILEGFKKISLYAIEQSIRFQSGQLNDENSVPNILEIDILTPTDRRLKYSYELLVSNDEDSLSSDSSKDIELSWNDNCQYIDGDKEIVWTTSNGVTTLKNSGLPITLGITSSVRRLNSPKNLAMNGPDEAGWIYSILKGINFIQTTPTRHSRITQYPERMSSFIRVLKKGITILAFSLPDELSSKIFQMKSEVRRELEVICQRVSLGQKISVQESVMGEQINGESIVSVSLDSVNIGLLSDGTLRVLSILIGIMDSSSSATTIIEEPEIHIHPAMLERLLNEIESYTYCDNLLIATQSPQVVAWMSPDKINLVHRTDGKTIVRKLGEVEIQNVIEYLSEEGSLGEWLYSGIVDE